MAAIFKHFDTFGILHQDLTIIFRSAVKSRSCRILPSLQVFPTVTTQHRSYARSASSNDSSNNNRSKVAHARTKAPAGIRTKKDVVYKQIVDIIRKGSLAPLKLCTAYSTGERYNLQALQKGLDQRKYVISSMPEDLNDVIHANVRMAPDNTHCGEVFMFKQGALVCWGLPESEVLHLRSTMKKYQEEAYNESLIDRETEQFPFTYSKQPSTLFKGRIILNEEGCEETRMLEKYAFSNALALSVKLAMWESALDEYADSIKWVPEVLKQGKKLKLSRKQVLSKRGELISLRYKTNLYSDLLITPDFYWDRSELESVYTNMVFHLEIDRRTKVLNEKLNYCSELADLLTSHLNEKHSNTLEMGIIALIAVEVIFEVIHLAMRFLEGY